MLEADTLVKAAQRGFLPEQHFSPALLLQQEPG